MGRAPHEATCRPDGKEAWITVRGEDYLSVIDVARMRETRRVAVPNGPGQIAFSPDGKLAFVCSSFSPELAVVDVATYKVIKKIPVVSPFSPNIFPTKDGQQIWFTHKDVGKVSVLDTRTLTISGVLTTGPISNHVATVDVAAGDFAYVTVGGENAVKVYSRQLLATIPVGPNPHGLWPNGDGSRLYVGLENGDALVSIDTKTNTKLTETGSGQAPQALLYVVKAGGGTPGTGNLEAFVPVAPVNIRLVPLGTQPVPGVGGGATIRPVEDVDEMVLALKQLAASTTYTLYLSDAKTRLVAPEPVLAFKTDAEGKVEVNAYYQIRLRLPGRFAVVVRGDKDPAGAVTLTQP